jgi:hypothetical protein
MPNSSGSTLILRRSMALIVLFWIGSSKLLPVRLSATLFGAAWVATKLTQPIRILATLAITPLVAAVVRKVRGPRPEEPSDDVR